MDTSIIATLIGILGAGTIGLLGFMLTGLRDGIQDNGKRLEGFGERLTRLEERFVALEERCVSEFGQIKDVLSRIEATQAEHGRQIEKLGGDQP